MEKEKQKDSEKVTEKGSVMVSGLVIEMEILMGLVMR